MKQFLSFLLLWSAILMASPCVGEETLVKEILDSLERQRSVLDVSETRVSATDKKTVVYDLFKESQAEIESTKYTKLLKRNKKLFHLSGPYWTDVYKDGRSRVESSHEEVYDGKYLWRTNKYETEFLIPTPWNYSQSLGWFWFGRALEGVPSHDLRPIHEIMANHLADVELAGEEEVESIPCHILYADIDGLGHYRMWVSVEKPYRLIQAFASKSSDDLANEKMRLAEMAMGAHFVGYEYRVTSFETISDDCAIAKSAKTRTTYYSEPNVVMHQEICEINRDSLNLSPEFSDGTFQPTLEKEKPVYDADDNRTRYKWTGHALILDPPSVELPPSS